MRRIYDDGSQLVQMKDLEDGSVRRKSHTHTQTRAEPKILANVSFAALIFFRKKQYIFECTRPLSKTFSFGESHTIETGNQNVITKIPTPKATPYPPPVEIASNASSHRW